MQLFKQCAIAVFIGILLGAGIVLFAMYRPASATITDLRAEHKRLVEQYRIELSGYTDLLTEARERAGTLSEDLGRATEEHRIALERVARAEDAARSLQELIGEIQESGGRASEYNRAIRDEAETALEGLRGYREALAGSSGYSGEEDAAAED